MEATLSLNGDLVASTELVGSLGQGTQGCGLSAFIWFEVPRYNFFTQFIV